MRQVFIIGTRWLIFAVVALFVMHVIGVVLQWVTG